MQQCAGHHCTKHHISEIDAPTTLPNVTTVQSIRQKAPPQNTKHGAPANYSLHCPSWLMQKCFQHRLPCRQHRWLDHCHAGACVPLQVAEEELLHSRLQGECSSLECCYYLHRMQQWHTAIGPAEHTSPQPHTNCCKLGRSLRMTRVSNEL